MLTAPIFIYPSKKGRVSPDQGGRLKYTYQPLKQEKDLKSYDFRSFLVEISGIEPLTS